MSLVLAQTALRDAAAMQTDPLERDRGLGRGAARGHAALRRTRINGDRNGAVGVALRVDGRGLLGRRLPPLGAASARFRGRREGERERGKRREPDRRAENLGHGVSPRAIFDREG